MSRRKSCVLHGVLESQKKSHSTLRVECSRVHWKCQKLSILTKLWNPEACGQTVLPGRSLILGQKLVENTK